MFRPLRVLCASLVPILAACGPDRGSIPSVPPPVTAATAYDSARGAVVLFGSLDGTTRGLTYAWDGGEWIQRAVDGPSPRQGHAMAYDSIRGRVVLFGGFAKDAIEVEDPGDGGSEEGGAEGSGDPPPTAPRTTHLLQDTWEWDGVRWERRATDGPVPRYGHAMTFDDDKQVTVLFGGVDNSSDGNKSNETWVWDGETWTAAVFSFPPVTRSQHALTFDHTRKKTVLFGGFSNSGFLGDTWEWNGDTVGAFAGWRRSVVDGPSARGRHAFAWDAGRGVSVLYGGFDDRDDDQTWEWDGAFTTWRRRSPPASRVHDPAPPTPGPRSGHQLAYDTHRGVTVLYGGRDAAGFVPETWEWDGRCWSSGDEWLASAYDEARGVVVLYGSFLASGGAAQTWEWDGSAWTLRADGDPPLRGKPAMAYDSVRGVTVLVRAGVQSESSETWEWDGSNWHLVSTDGPTSRIGPVLAYDSGRERTVMHGGFDGTYDNETWEWDGSAWALVSTLGPGARGRHSMVYDSARGVCVLFGGWPVDADFDGAKNEASPDTWEWDGATWSKVATAGPAGRTDAAMCFDRKLGVTVLFGGFVGPAFSNELWTWDGTTWVHAADLLDSQVPSHRHRAAMAYDTARSRCVLFGGTGASQEHDTWEFDGEVWVKASDGGARPGR